MQPTTPGGHNPRPLLIDTAWLHPISPVPSVYGSSSRRMMDPTPQTRGSSTVRTTPSSPLPSSSHLPSSSPLYLHTESSESAGPPLRLSIRKRPRIADLKHYQSSPNVLSESSPAQRGRPTQRRSVSADSANRARTWFTSPDRFISSRPTTSSPESPTHLGRAVPNLTPRERYTRRRDPDSDPFRSGIASRSRAIAKRRLPNAIRRVTPAQYTPSFVYGADATPRHAEIAVPGNNPRQISAGAVWSVGGPFSAQIAPTTAIPDGRGALFGSGTNAPVHVAHFLDHDTPDQELYRHENRLALALELDLAERILTNTHSNLLLQQEPSTFPRSIDWRHNTWTQGVYERCKVRSF